MPEYRSAIRTNRIPIQGLLAEQAPDMSAPAAPTEGLVWHDTTNQVWKIYLGGAWRTVSISGHVHAAGDITSGTFTYDRGGTGQSSLWSQGGLIFAQSTSVLSSIQGTAGQIVTMGGGTAAPVFRNPTLSSAMPTESWKTEVRAVQSANIALPPGGTTLTVDGVTMADNDRVLLRSQSTPSQNGIYFVAGIGSAVTLTRATDADVSAEVACARVIVSEGTTYAGSQWMTTFKPTDTLGTTAMSWYRVLDTSLQGVSGGYEGYFVAGTTGQYYRGDKSWQTLDKTAVGLGNVPNTDATNASNIGSGTLAVARLGTSGTRDSTTILDGSGAWRTFLGTSSTTALAGDTRLNSITAPNGSVAMNSQKITGLLDPTAAQDAATKNYVDLAVQGIDARASVKAASTGAITLFGAQTIDGVSVVAGDRVLVKDNVTPTAQNGVYIASSGVWTRAADFDVWTDFPSAFVWVEQGTTNGDTGWLCTNDAGGTLDTTGITFVQFSGAGQVTAGAGLTKTGNTLDVVGTTNRISVAADSIDISSSYVGQATITTLGTVATGTWNATAIALNKGGTGATAAPAARTALEAVGSYTGLNPALSVATWTTVNHNLGHSSLHRPNVTFTKVSDGEQVIIDWRYVDTNNIEIRADMIVNASVLNVNVVARG
jgi:hypothetical protein